jgi:hypothetical protein
MKTQANNYVKFIAVAAVLAFSCGTVLGDDLTPPPWRGNPLSVMGEWQLILGSTILNQTQWNTVGSPGINLYPLAPPAQVMPASGNVYDLLLPNFVDNMPIKYMRLQLTWSNSGPPINVFSQALDGVNSILGTITFASVPVLNTAGNGFYQYYDIEFLPNPDFERVLVQLPAGGLMTQIVIDTVSTVPEPATMAILGLGSLALRIRRRA